ncbi:MAG: hypothetical protein ACI9OJ_003442 [Myxococcota bacterium]
MLATIQTDLERLYRLDRPFDVQHFVLARSQVNAPLDRPEQVLVHEADDALELALVLDDALLEPLVDWNLDRFCVCAEGVSHMLYLAVVADRSSQVSQLELELQAEIDKFVLLLMAVGMPAAQAIDRLFVANRLRSDLSDDERGRYAEANRMALLFCRYLVGRFVRRSRIDQMLAEIRRVYRMGGARKRAYVNECRL